MPGQSMAGLTMFGQGFAPIAPGIDPNRPLPLAGIPGLQNSYGQILSLMAAPGIMRMMGAHGQIPMGLGHDQNVYDRLLATRLMRDQMQTMQQAAAQDRESFFRMFRGVAAVTGTPFGADQRFAADTLASGLSSLAPLAAQFMPDYLDQFGGNRGSATVLARRLLDSGRYRLDASTGRMGTSVASAASLQRAIQGDLFSDENIGGMRGFRMGQIGSLAGELQMRGLLPTGAAARGGGAFDQQVRSAITSLGPARLDAAAANVGVDLSHGINKLSAADIDKLSLDPSVVDRLRSFDADRVKRTLKSYTQAIGAMRDIFGDMGNPNAPMNELIQGLEAMTMGATSQLDPARLSTMVRQTYNLAKQTGVPLDNALLLQQHAGVRAQGLGLPPVFAVQATQGALAFGGAYRAGGHGAFPAWNAMSADALQQLDANLRVQAASSNMANRAAVGIRLSDQYGGLQAGSDAARFVEAARTGENEWIDAAGKTRSLSMTDNQFATMFRGAKNRNGEALNVTRNDVFALLGQRTTNQENVLRYNLGDTVRRSQGKDQLNPAIAGRMQETIYARLRGQGLTDDQARKAAISISRPATDRVSRLSEEEFSDTGMRNAAIGEIMLEEMKKAGGVLPGMTGGQQRDFFRQTADRFYGATEEWIRRSPYRAYGSFQNVHRLNNPVTLDDTSRSQLQASLQAEMQEAMSPLGHGSVLQRAVTALQTMREGDQANIPQFLAPLLGGVKMDDINAAIVPQLQRVATRQKELEKLASEINAARTPAERNRLRERHRTLSRELAHESRSLSTLNEQYGVFNADMLTGEDVQRAGGSMAALEAGQKAVTGLFAGQDAAMFTISDADRTAFRESMSGKLSAKTLANPAEVDRLLVRDRALSRRQRFDEFWASPSGGKYREDATAAMADAETLADKLTRGPQMMQRFGTRATEIADTLRSDQQRLRELALFHAGGDMAKLTAGDFDIDVSTAEGRKTAEQIRAEVSLIQQRTKTTTAEIGQAGKVSGHNFLRSDRDEAIRLLGVTPDTLAAREGDVAAMSKKVGVLRKLTPGQEATIRGGNEADAKLSRIATQYKVSVDELLRMANTGDSKLAQGDAEAIQLTAKDRDRYRGEIEEITKTTGFSRSDLSGAMDAKAAFEKTFRDYERQSTVKPEDAVRRLLSSHGFQVGDQLSGSQQQLLWLGSTAAGRRMLQRGAESGEHLQQVAERGGGRGTAGVDTLARDYQAIGGDAAKISAFRMRYGFAGDAAGDRDFQSFERDLRFQKQIGLLQVGKDRALNHEDDLLRSLTRGSSGRGGAAVSGSAGAVRIDGTLAVTIKSDGTGRGELHGAAVSGRDMLPVGA